MCGLVVYYAIAVTEGQLKASHDKALLWHVQDYNCWVCCDGFAIFVSVHLETITEYNYSL